MFGKKDRYTCDKCGKKGLEENEVTMLCVDCTDEGHIKEAVERTTEDPKEDPKEEIKEEQEDKGSLRNQPPVKFPN